MRRIPLLPIAVSMAVLLAACGGEPTATAPTGVSTPATPTTLPAQVVSPSTTTTTLALRDGLRLAERIRPLGSAIPQPPPPSPPAPVSLAIDAIGVLDAPVVDVGVEESGEMEIPGAREVGWYRYGPTPGDEGSAVLAAHIAFDGRDGVFRRLADLQVGAIVEVGFEDGTTRRFEVIGLAQYPKEELPFDRVFAREGEPVLTLVTCGGAFDRSARSYEDNVVAYAVPLASPSD